MKNRAYTHTAQLSPNFLIGGIQLLFWVLFHPSACRAYLQRLDPTLPLDFCLASLTAQQRQNPTLRRFVAQTVLWMPLLGALTGMVYLALMGERPEALLVHVIYGLGFGWTAALIMAYFLSPVVAMSYATALCLLLTISDPFNPNTAAIPIVLSAGFVGLSVSAIYPLAVLPKIFSIGRMTVGVFSNIGILLVVVWVIVRDFVDGNQWGFREITSPDEIGFWLVLLSILGIWVMCVAIVILLRSQYRRRDFGWLAGFFVALMVVNLVAYVLPRTELLFYLLRGMVSALVVSALLLATWAITLRLAGPHTSALTATLAGGIFWIPVADLVILRFELSLNALVTAQLIAYLISLQFLWRPLVFYFPLGLWNRLLLVMDEQIRGGRAWFFRYHAAFWDEHQYLRWIGLDEHLLLVAEKDPLQAEQAINFLMQTRQRWAVSSVQVELEAEQLEACSDIQQIRLAHRSWENRDLSGSMGSILGVFVKTSQEVDLAMRQSNSNYGRVFLKQACDRLNRLEQEIILSTSRSQHRFLPILSAWLQIITRFQIEWDEKILSNVELDNPYICGIPLNDSQKVFVGRTDLMQRIEHLIFDPHSPSLLLYGQRRMGKTSLLLNLGRILPPTVVPLFVDLQGVGGSPQYAYMVYDIVLQMRRSAERQRGLELPPLSREDLESEDDSAQRLTQWLDDLEKFLETRNLTGLVMLDEFEALDRSMTANNIPVDLFLGKLRYLIQHRPRFRVILAGAHTLTEFNKWATYLINIQVLKVGYLETEEVIQLVSNPVRNFPLRYEPAAIQAVLNLTRGHPNLVQLVGYELVVYKNDQPIAHRFLATLEDIEQIIPYVLESGSIFFMDIEQNQISPLGARLLHLMADDAHRGFLRFEDLDRFSDQPNLEACLQNLLQRDLIEACTGGFCFQVDLVRRWFQRAI